MSSFINSGSDIPSTSSQLSLGQQQSALHTTLLVKELINLALKKTNELTVRNNLYLPQEHTAVLIVTSNQLLDISNETSKSCFEIADAIIKSKIDLKHKLNTKNLLLPQEVESIKKFLTGIHTQPATVVSQTYPSASNDDQQPSTSQASLSASTSSNLDTQDDYESPSKRLRISTSVSPTVVSEPPLCSLQVFTAFLEHIQSKTPQTPFLCPLGHESLSCSECSALQSLLATSPITNLNPSLWQLEVLLHHTNPQNLALQLHNTPRLLNKVISGSYLNNCQLVSIIAKCGISQEIYPKSFKPKAESIPFYQMADELTSMGESSPLVRAVLQTWEKTSFSPSALFSSILVEEDGSIGIYCDSLLEKRIPELNRHYMRCKDPAQSKGKKYIKCPLGPTITNIIAKVVIRTLSAMQQHDANADLFQKTPYGCIPTTHLFDKIVTIVLLSNQKWHFILPSCKASVHNQVEDISFDTETKQKLCKALQNFSKKHGLFLPSGKSVN